MQHMHSAIRELQVWDQLLAFCLNTPPRPTWGHSMHCYDQAPQNRLIYMPIDSFRRQDSNYLIYFNRRVTPNSYVAYRLPFDVLFIRTAHPSLLLCKSDLLPIQGVQ